VPERLLLLCVASGTDFRQTKIPDKVATEVVVKGLVERDRGGHLGLTDRGRSAPVARTCSVCALTRCAASEQDRPRTWMFCA
jgi:hypothetical protein